MIQLVYKELKQWQYLIVMSFSKFKELKQWQYLAVIIYSRFNEYNGIT